MSEQAEQTGVIKPAESKDTTKKFSRGGDTFKVPLSMVRVQEDFNKRDDNNYGDIEELANSIEEFGQLDPAHGYFDKENNVVIVTAGHRRLKALHEIAKRTKEEPKMLFRFGARDRKERLLIQFAENVKQPNTDWDRAMIIKGLKDEGMENAEMIQKLGMKAPTFYACLKLLDTPDSVKDHLSKGEISGTTVNALIRVNKDAEALSAAVEEAVGNAKQAGKKKATARHASTGDTRTTTSILKTFVGKLEGKAEDGKATKNELFALSLFKAVVDKVSDRTLNEKIRDGK